MIILSVVVAVLVVAVWWLLMSKFSLEERFTYLSRETNEKYFDFLVDLRESMQKDAERGVFKATTIEIPVVDPTERDMKADGVIKISIKEAIELLMQHFQIVFQYERKDELVVKSAKRGK